MKLKDAARIACLIDTEGSIRIKDKIYKGDTSTVRIHVDITNTDLGIINWAIHVLEKELGHRIPLYKNTGNNPRRTKECYRIDIHRLDDVRRILNISRGYMISIKKEIADRVVSFLNHRETLLNNNGNLEKKNLEAYNKAYWNLVNKVKKIKRTYDKIEPVTTIHDSDLLDRKI